MTVSAEQRCLLRRIQQLAEEIASGVSVERERACSHEMRVLSTEFSRLARVQRATNRLPDYVPR